MAASGVTTDADPDPSALLASLPTFGWSSNWAGGYGNALEAYYAWMYYDGWGGGRPRTWAPAKRPTASGCWGHREDVLSFPDQGLLWMGGLGAPRLKRPDRLRDDAGLDAADQLDEHHLQLGKRPGRRSGRGRRAHRGAPLSGAGHRTVAPNTRGR